MVFIGEALGRKEAETGRPFAGRSGKFLRAAIKNTGFDEKSI
ncbi:MAG: uracil-DNA glycosylase, partial [Thaumarchaeota archaeon]|nr:uracil-DNA glycosylase [Nitrososphaerota archaeon]